ncbi:DUF815 domain-containing protein [Calditerrivibrio nitroreducens]|uniref:Uncharacterized protein n=1 Tax=Calditerrivibrio nitroreducens (strain DSM 19672 / NBRC 101217 / Yu37-1) TaxID=768670 RepID=E4TJ60_CALNY|nr:DUF815 domain-containing protein [Calditerrivibrio nitroreducens]ADR18096.1 protein of unknown function DUF815 [Calditerrivibrio nitroreducens DSM 19672]
MFSKHIAFLWDNSEIIPINIRLKYDNLICLDEQINRIEKNIISFIDEGVYLNMLLWGERGGGKSSIIKNILYKYHSKGLKIIQHIDDNLKSIYKLYEIVSTSEYKFILFFDDISFNYDDERYRSFKSLLEGGLIPQPENLMIVATSNRRHLIFEKAHDSSDFYSRDDENESISLYSRFGLVVGFYPMNREDYLKITSYYLNLFNLNLYENWEGEAENFAINRGGRSGRVAKQFAIYKKIFG